jgi:hypothetical protein
MLEYGNMSTTTNQFNECVSEKRILEIITPKSKEELIQLVLQWRMEALRMENMLRSIYAIAEGISK